MAALPIAPSSIAPISIDRRARTLGDYACIAAFAAATLVPLFGRALDRERVASTLAEERNPAPFPSAANPLGFPAGFEAWLGDHYGFRGHLIRWRNAALLLGLGVSPTDQLVAGPGPWLFTTANRALEAHRGVFRLSETDLAAWAAALEERRAWLALRGAHYLVVFAPDKHAIYPERLPAGYARGAETPLDQLARYLAEHGSVEHLDLRQALTAARTDPRMGDREGDWLYYPLGTHWTDRGAWIAYREIVSALARRLPALEPPREADYARTVRTDPGDSWGARLRLPDLLVQACTGFEKLGPKRSRVVDDTTYEKVFEIPDAPELPRLVLFHDSFGSQLRDFLREDFARFHARSTTDFEDELVLAERPDVVIQLMAERRLATYRPPVAALGGDAAARAAFAAAGAPLFALDSAAAAHLSPWRRARLTPGTDPEDPPLVVRLRGPGDGVLLPEVELPPGSAPILKVDIECREAGELAIYYQTPASREYLSMRQVACPLAAGRNVVHIDLAVDDCTGRLLLMPGPARGDYVLRALELRARPR